MKIYHYDQETGEYLGEGETRLNPAFGEPEQPEYLIPAFAADDAPPPVQGSNEAARRRDGKWEIVPDFRGVTAYSITTRKLTPIASIGLTLEEMGLSETMSTPTPEEQVAAVAEVVKAKLREIDLKSIRSLRDGDTEWVEKWKNEAVIERAKVVK